MPEDAVIQTRTLERPGPGRPPATSHEELERIAFELFEAGGFEETSIGDIATAAGIARRTFFRYYPSKLDLVWGDFDAQLRRLSAFLDAVPADVPLMEAVHRAVVDFNLVAQEHEAGHRSRMALILQVPTLLANSTLRFAQWREVVAAFAARRLDVPADALLPNVIAYSALGATLAGYEEWLRDPALDLTTVLDEALGELADGFRHHGPG